MTVTSAATTAQDFQEEAVAELNRRIEGLIARIGGTGSKREATAMERAVLELRAAANFLEGVRFTAELFPNAPPAMSPGLAHEPDYRDGGR